MSHNTNTTTSSKGLHSIYAALDSHQYSRAIKLCLAQPKSHVLGRGALLAHAYTKARQRYKALCTLQEIFGMKAFPELQLAIQYSIESRNQEPARQQQQQQQSTSRKSGGKKGKKKGGSQQSSQPAVVKNTPASRSNNDEWDLIDQLDTPPTLPGNWEQQLPDAAGSSLVKPESTLLATLSMTLSLLNLPLTAYQLYCWAMTAATGGGNVEEEVLYTRKAYLSGLALLVAPQYSHIVPSILSNLQVLALQLARLQQQVPATMWASQTALWQIEFQANDTTTNAAGDDSNNEKQDQRLAMLPRLAESLAAKSVEEYSNSNNSTSTSSSSLLANESFLLYMRTLDLQSKWTEKLEALEERLSAANNTQQEQQTSPPRQALLEMKITTLQKLGRATEMKQCTEQLLEQFPDDWEYWTQYLEYSIAECDGNVQEGCDATRTLIAQAIDKHNSSNSRYPLRGPHLMRVELAAAVVRAAVNNDEAIAAEVVMSKLMDSIMVYGKEFSSKAHCTFSDLRPYLDLCLEICSEDHAHTLLKWSAEMRSVEPSSEDLKERRKELCVYIFAVQVNFIILSKFTELQDSELPSWEELVKVWRSFQLLEESVNVDQAQKESRSADELILLAVQRILYGKPSDGDRLIAACLLESAIRNSPFNANLKISAMFVYAELNAVFRSWELYNELDIKHIQNESCSYLILPLLRSCGFYREIVQVCQEIIAVHRSSRESPEFVWRAMDSGALSKAEEFIIFYRNRMEKSLTTLEAKGLILDCAPLLIPDDKQGELGYGYGIVGGDSDLERVNRMIEEAHNPAGAFSVLRLNETSINRFSDNRDFGILSYEILSKRQFETPECIVGECNRRRHQHKLLIRAALCVDATKGPKKGKASKCSKELEKRCKSLLMAVNDVVDTLDVESQPPGYKKLLLAVVDMCRAIVVLSSGMNLKTVPEHDNLDAREEVVLLQLQRANESLQSAQNELEKDLSVSRVCRLLPDCIVMVFALFQMCARIVDMFGWGPRKRKTKRCAGALADLSLSLASLITDMKNCLAVLPSEDLPSGQELHDKLAGFVDESVFSKASSFVLESQHRTHIRIKTIFDHVIDRLAVFYIDE